jgi:hypothetical protein
MWRFIVVVALALSASWLCGPICAWAETNLARNGDLSAGAGNTPSDWYPLSSEKKLSEFSWTKTPGDGGVLGISNPDPDFTSWHQPLILRPGIYEISAEARVEGALPKGGGANIAVQTYDGIRLISEHLHGTADWQKISFLLKEDRWGDTTQLLCQLGIAGHPDTGQASFRNIKVVSIASPPHGRERGYNLSALREHYKDQLLQPDSRGYVRVIGILCGLAMLALLGWALFEIWRPAITSGRSAWILSSAVMLAITGVKFAALFHFTGIYWDVWAKINHALLAVVLGPGKIYDPGVPVDVCPPGELYLLWFSGWIARILEPGADGFRVIVETPPLIADFLIGLTLYFAGWREGRAVRAMLVMLLFALNPALIFDTVVWGQSDSIVALPMLAAALLILAGRHRLGWSAAAIAILAKPQAAAIAIPLGLWTLLDAGIAECGWSAAAFAGTFAVGILPYQIGHSGNFIVNVYKEMGARFSDASVGAFNFMALVGGMGAPDADKTLGVSYRALGLSLTAAVYVISLYLVWRARSSRSAMLATFVALFGFFMFAPRIHERYLYYPIVFLIPIALESGALTAIFAVTSATFLFNLLYIKHLTDTASYFPDRPNFSIVAAASINLLIFFAATVYGLLGSPAAAAPRDDALKFRRTTIAVLALVAVVGASVRVSAQQAASQESPWASRAPATPVPGAMHGRVNVIHTSETAITPELQAFADKFIQSVQAKDPAKVRALIAPTTLACFDKSKQEFLDDWIEKQFRYQVPKDHRINVSSLPPSLFKPSTIETYPVPGTQLLEFHYTIASGTATATQAIGQEDGQWYLTPPCPTAAGMERFAKIQKMRAAGRERAERAYPQLQEPLKSQLLALIAKHQNGNAAKLCMKSLHVDYMTARALVTRLAGDKPD